MRTLISGICISTIVMMLSHGLACSQSSQSSRKIEKEKITLKQALNLGFRAMEDNKVVYKEDGLDIRISKKGSRWVMSVTILPPTPGRDFVITIDEAGETDILALF